jgi:hypothetical protein
MSNISAWSTSSASNNAASPDGAPEGMLPSGVNDVIRENMAAIRRWYNDAEWVSWNHNLVRQSDNSFLVSVTATDVYTANRRLKMIDGGVTIYGDVVASSMSGANTLVTVSSSNLSASLSSGSVSIIDPANSSLPFANQTAMEAGTATTRPVSPANLHFHTGIAKGRVTFTPAGAVSEGYNVTSVTDSGTGNWTVVWATDFSNTTYTPVATGQRDDDIFINVFVGSTHTAGNTELRAQNENGADLDGNLIYCVAFGDFA